MQLQATSDRIRIQSWRDWQGSLVAESVHLALTLWHSTCTLHQPGIFQTRTARIDVIFMTTRDFQHYIVHRAFALIHNQLLTDPCVSRIKIMQGLASLKSNYPIANFSHEVIGIVARTSSTGLGRRTTRLLNFNTSCTPFVDHQAFNNFMPTPMLSI
jgi:hypothetical protein